MTRTFHHGSKLIPLLMGAVVLSGCGGRDTQPPVDLVDEFSYIARDLIHNKDQVSADDLADWIIQGRKDFLLVDVRSQDDFNNGHIDTAENMPLTYLVERRTLEQLPRDRLLVLYSNGTDHAGQAAVMLRLAGLKAYALGGGYNFWQQRILNPDLNLVSEEQAAEVEKRRAIACYFAGNYRAAGGEQAAAPAPAAYTPPLAPIAPAEPLPPQDEGTLIIEEGC